MNMYRSIGTASAYVVDRAMEALVAGLELEFEDQRAIGTPFVG